MPDVVKNLAGGKAISGGSLQPRGRRGNTAQVAAYWSGGGPVFMAATGGTTNDYVLNGITYRSHTFASSGSFIVTTAGDTPQVDVLVIGGGGGGGGRDYGGGGGGGYGNTATQTLTATTYSLTVGNAGGNAYNPAAGGGSGGGTTTFNGISGAGGGPGGSNYGGASGNGGGIYTNGGSGNITSNSYRTGSAETFSGGGQGLTGGYTAARGSGIYGAGGGGSMNYNQVDYNGEAPLGGCVIIRYRIA